MHNKVNTDYSFSVFTFLWAAATIFHLAKWSRWLASPFDFALGISAFLVLLKPSSIGRFSLLIFVQLLTTFEQLPQVSNHLLFIAFVNMTILLALARLLVSTKSLTVDRSKLYHAFAPALRIELLLLYLFSSFHKLNADWFNPEVSCGAEHYLLLAERLPFLPTSLLAQKLAIYGTLFFEAAIPVLLLVPHLRITGLLAAILFHFVLAMNTFFNFSALMFALLFLFVPENSTQLLVKRWEKSSIKKHSKAFTEPGFLNTASLSATILLGIFAAVVFIISPWPDSSQPTFLIREEAGIRTTISYLFEALWWVYALGLVTLFLLTIGSRKLVWHDFKELFTPTYVIVMAIPVLVFINGASPYLGLKTETSFSMFSNLRTEAGKSNHLLIDRNLRLTGYQDDLVSIVSSSDPLLQKLADLEYEIPYFELRSYTSHLAQHVRTDIELIYFRNGEQKVVNSVSEEPLLSKRHPTLLRKLLYFRPVRPEETNRCQH